MTDINVTDYWDFCTEGQSYTVDWYQTIGGGLCFSNHNYWTTELGGCTRQDTYTNAGVQQDSWYYRNDPAAGVLEIADNAPKASIWDKIFLFWASMRQMVYKTGREIPWGHVQTVGTTVQWPVVIDHWRSKYLPPFQGYWSYATQICEYVELMDTFTDSLGRVHQDVLKLRNAQPWGKADSTDQSNSACIYYLKKGVGRIAVEWITYDRNGLISATQPMQSAVYTGSIILPAS